MCEHILKPPCFVIACCFCILCYYLFNTHFIGKKTDLEKLAGVPKLHSFCSVTEPRLKPRFSDSLSNVLSAVP